MQNPYAVTFEPRKLFIDPNATQMLQHILSNCLPSLYGRASEFFATRPTPRTQCKTRFSLHIPTWTSSGAGHTCPLG
jgi:hypothetical protein